MLATGPMAVKVLRNGTATVVHMIDDALAELDSNDSNVKVLLRNY